MKSTFGALLVCLLMLPSFAAAQGSIKGQWAGEVPSASGPQVVQMSIGIDDEQRIHGSIIGQGAELSILNATVAGNLVQFSTRQTDGDTETTYNWTGTINGDEISFSCVDEQRRNPAIEFVVRRQG